MMDHHADRAHSKRIDFFDRRTFITGTAATTLAAGLGTNTTIAQAQQAQAAHPSSAQWAVSVFSKHLQWLEYQPMAETAADIGFSGVDLTVRSGGHVLPERVEDDLPKAVEAVRSAGLEVYQITTEIEDPSDVATEPILKSAAALGIRYYRIGSWFYDRDRDLLDQIRGRNARLKDLAAMNERYGIVAGYHNHSGGWYLGAGMWDIHLMLDGVDPQWVGCNFDAAHAVADGASSAWRIAFKLLAGRFKMCSVKDCLYVPTDDGYRWNRVMPAVGKGMTPWPEVVRMMKESGFTGPFSMHFEYETGGGSEKEKQQNLVKAMRRDLQAFRGILADAGMG